MKKFGFTLSELLITVGIVGVVAALTAPAVSNIMPDRNKMMFMKNYKELTTITQKLLNDPELYYTPYAIAEEDKDLDGDGEIDVLAGRKYPTCIGLGCYGTPLREPYKSGGSKYSSYNSKYYCLLHNYLGKNFNDGCWHEYTGSDRTYWNGGSGSLSSSGGDFYEHWSANIYFVVYFVGPNHKTTCAYGDANCKKPHKFKFKIDEYGNVTPNDPLSKAYLLNPNNMNNKKRDLACAEALKGGAENCDDIEE